MTDDEHPTTADDAAADDSGGGVPASRPPSAVHPLEDGSRGNPLSPPESPPDRLGSPEDGPDGTVSAAPPARRRRPVLRWVLWGSLFGLLAAVAITSQIKLNYYAIQPGTAQPVQPFIKVPPSKGHPVADPVLLTDVREARVTALNYLLFKLQPNTVLYSVPSVTGGVSPSELDAQGALQMSQAETAAKVASLRHLGYTVPGTPVGAVIAGTFPGTPAYGVLDVGDVVTAVDAQPTVSAEALTTALSKYKAGQTVTFTVRKHGTAPPGPVPLTLRRTVVDVGGEHVALTVGIQPQDQVDYTYPFPVSIDVVDIGGPSAGLAMTLGVIDTLSGGKLTGGHTVAATGTMDSLGNVGDVGGVAQKTVAVENAGATIFMVPPGEYKDAKSKQRPGLKIYPVSTLDQALQVLRDNGGTVPSGTLVSAASQGAG